MKTIANIIHQNNFPLFILDSSENTIYYEQSDEYWCKSEFDDNDNLIYIESSNGIINDTRP